MSYQTEEAPMVTFEKPGEERKWTKAIWLVATCGLAAVAVSSVTGLSASSAVDLAARDVTTTKEVPSWTSFTKTKRLERQPARVVVAPEEEEGSTYNLTIYGRLF